MADPAPAAPDPNSHEARSAALFARLWNDSTEAGRLFRAEAKKLYPDVKTPEDSVEPAVAPLRAELDELRTQNKALMDKWDARDKADTDRQAETTLQEALGAARAKFRLNDEGFDKMVARMKETGNFTDAESAAAWVAMQTPPPPPPGPAWRPQGVNYFGDADSDDLKRLHQDPAGFADDELADFARDPGAFTRRFAPEYFQQ